MSGGSNKNEIMEELEEVSEWMFSSFMQDKKYRWKEDFPNSDLRKKSQFRIIIQNSNKLKIKVNHQMQKVVTLNA